MWVITAAHCIYGKKKDEITVVLGRYLEIFYCVCFDFLFLFYLVTAGILWKVIEFLIASAKYWTKSINLVLCVHFGFYLGKTLYIFNIWILHCVKSVRIQSFSGPYFPAFGLNTERYSVSLRIQSKRGKIRTRKTHAVLKIYFLDCSVAFALI